MSRDLEVFIREAGMRVGSLNGEHFEAISMLARRLYPLPIPMAICSRYLLRQRRIPLEQVAAAGAVATTLKFRF